MYSNKLTNKPNASALHQFVFVKDLFRYFFREILKNVNKNCSLQSLKINLSPNVRDEKKNVKTIRVSR